ncbi:MAG: HD-GYP domain-containing protein [Firmicutes bacterium HGW-Firmicutes-15]|nr:MAG: HD-GYP domain-containing protein [Firmicutes bacterium HGW-Firmicutes-15]
MRRLPIDGLEPGMMIARDVLSVDGRILLTKNSILNTDYIFKLRTMGLGSLYIKDNLSDIEIPEIISAQVMTAVSSTLRNSINNFTSNKKIDMEMMYKGVKLLIEDIMSNRNIPIQLEDIRTYNDYLLFHSVNVAVFSIMTGLSMGYGEGTLTELGVGALLHDIGMIAIDPSILNKPGPLSAQENEIVERHPEIGFNILRSYRELSTTAAHISFQHHERVDGSGYPRQFLGKQIIIFGKIAAVADTYDALVSDRPYRKGYSTIDGVIVLRKLSGSYFDPEVVEAFVSNIAIYPIGILLLLNTGQIAVVTDITKINPRQPVVRVILDKDGNFENTPFEIDFRKNKDITIIRRLTMEETDAIRARIKVKKS